MARQKTPVVRRVKKNEERRRPGIFLSLKDQEKLTGYALFEPDAELEKNPGYYEYFSHFDPSGPAMVPCLGEDCLMCERGDNPSTRALTLWYFPENPVAERLKVFSANPGTIEDMIDEAEDVGGLLGKQYRVKRRGTAQKTRYRLTNMNSSLPKKEVTTLLKNLEIDLEDIVNRQAIKQYERLKAIEALDEDEDEIEEVDEDEDEDEVEAKKGTEVDDDEDEDEEEEDEDEDEDEEEEEEEEAEEAPEPIEAQEFQLVSVSKAKNYVKVEHDGELTVMYGDDDNSVEDFKKGDEVVIHAEWDEDEEQWNISSINQAEEEAEEEEEDEDEDEDEQTEIESESVTIVSVNEDEEILTVKSSNKELGQFDLYLPEGIDLDFDDFAKGTKLTITAAKDDEGDWVLTEEPVIEKAKKPGRKPARRKK